MMPCLAKENNMKKYRVLFSNHFLIDLQSIIDYIDSTFGVRKSAEIIAKSLVLKCNQLDEMPNRNPIVFIGESGNQYRRVKEGNFSAFYVIDEEKSVVEVFRVLYERMDYPEMLNDSEQ